MRASEARAIYQKTQDECLKDVYAAIKKAAPNNTHLFWYENLNLFQLEKLRKDGYKIEDNTSQRDGILYQINW